MEIPWKYHGNTMEMVAILVHTLQGIVHLIAMLLLCYDIMCNHGYGATIIII